MHMNNMHEEKSHDWEEIYANCDFGLSSEPRAKDVRRKPILAEREMTSERVWKREWMRDGVIEDNERKETEWNESRDEEWMC